MAKVNYAEFVFIQEELRELILHHAIPRSRQDGSVDATTTEIIRSLRLVSKSWLQTVTKLLRKRKQPLFRLVLNRREGVYRSDTPRRRVEESREKLARFVDQLVNESSEPIPTVYLSAMSAFFRRENHDSFCKFLQKCGTGLVDVSLFPPENGGSLPSIFPRLSLPLLKRLSIFRGVFHGLRNEDEEERSSEHSTNLTQLIHAFLSGADSLSEFIYDGMTPPPQNFQMLILPSSITTVVLSCLLKSVDLDVLIKNTLPNLAILRLMVTGDPFSVGLLFKVLDNFKKTLKEFDIGGTRDNSPLRRTTLLSLPVMEKLERLQIDSAHCELEPNLTSLERCLPQATSLDLQKQSATMFQKWMSDSQFESVVDLTVELINDNVYDSDRDYLRTLDLEMIQYIHLAFPNVRKLDVRIFVDHGDAFKYLFQEMQNLRDLTISVGRASQDLNSDFFDALIIGTTVGMVTGLRTNPDWRMVELNNDHVPSIRMLKELKTLHFENDYRHPIQGREERPFISDLIFHFALLRMPNLKDLSLGDHLYASAEMIEIWRSQGRTIDQ